MKATVPASGGTTAPKKEECFKCGDSWFYIHQCKTKILNAIEGEEYDEREEIIAKLGHEEPQVEGKVTFSAITCYSPLSTKNIKANLCGK